VNRRIAGLLLALFALPVCSLASELIQFKDTTTSWANVLSIASKEKKLIFLDAYTDWCSWCKVMDKETFTDSAVAKFMNEKFVPVKYEMETGFGAAMSAKYRVNAFPTFLIFTADGKLVNRILGYRKSKEFLEKLAVALDPAKHDHLAGISTALDPGFPEFYKQSFLKRETRQHPDSATVHAFLASAKDLTGEVAWSVMYRFSALLSKKYKDFIYQNYDRLKKMYGADDVESSISLFLTSDLAGAIKTNNESALERIMAASQKYIDEPVAEMRLNYRMRFYRGTNRWTSFADLIDSVKNSGDKLDENAMNSYCWAIYEKCDDKQVVARASKWMGDVVEKSPKYMILDTYAALLFKNGELKKAKQYAELAISTGKGDNEDVSETESLLKKINASLERKP
jgi:thioredoxin-related protein